MNQEPEPVGAGMHFTTNVSGTGQAFVAGGDMIVFDGPAPVAMAALPAAPAYLVGRAEQLDALSEFFLAAPEGPSFTNIALITGFAGSGKRALATAAARQALQRGRFTGGVVFVDLEHDDGRPLSRGQALASALFSLGLRHSAEMGGSDADRTSLYRSLLQDRAVARGPVLVVADNASRPDQVDVLLPGSGEHRLLVTSRELLPIAGARTVVTGPLDAADSFLLLHYAVERRGLSRIGSIESLTSTEMNHLHGLLELSGLLPAAITEIAHHFSQDGGLTAEELLGDLTKALDSYTEGGPPDGPLLAPLRRGFDETYLRLGPEAAELLPLLGLVPGPNITSRQAAHLAGPDRDDIRSRLAALARAHLVAEERVGCDRWRLHPHARREATALARRLPQAVREAAQRRLLDEYARIARIAVEETNGEGSALHLRAGRKASRERFEAECPNLVPGVDMAVSAGLDRHAAELALPVCQLLLHHHRFDELATCAKAGVGAARRAGDRTTEAELLNVRGGWLRKLGGHHEALGQYTQAHDIFAALDDRPGRAKTLGNIASIHYERGEFEQAYVIYREVAAEFLALGDTRLEAMCLKNAGDTLAAADELDAARHAYTESIKVYRQRGDLDGEAEVLNSLGELLRFAGPPQEALPYYNRALQLAEDAENPGLQGAALRGAGECLIDGTARRRREALRMLQRAADLLEQSGNLRAHAAVCGRIGRHYYDTRKYARAIDYLHRAGIVLLHEFKDTDAAAVPLGLMDQARRVMEGRGLLRTPLNYLRGQRPPRSWEVGPGHVFTLEPKPWTDGLSDG
ncbi:tetratricopeptide repeat protein [Streptomyces sp. W1SF4]|uniref:tetratricopeptide repeat protein n=1 Tax=Streptomyces sp. W1SF4 TaxID=2305220 RepID=UPI000F6C7CB5|nr:tetratricopeptide repeat protein [Streptomyces sp. W1SF4]AZM92469.1 tetratricopeptide repeat protein [Streptomyces sp. W1SF4]